MNIISSLENYRIPLIHDRKALDILSLIAFLGPLKKEEFFQHVPDKGVNSASLILELYKSGVISKNEKNEWCISELGSLTLSKIGITQLASSTILKEDFDLGANNWLVSLINNEKDMLSSASIYDRVKIVTWFDKNINKYEVKGFDEHMIPCLYFSAIKDFYTFDSETFYDVHIINTPDISIARNDFNNKYDACRRIINTSNRLFSTGTIDDSDENNFVYLFSSIRMISSVIVKLLDFGLQTPMRDVNNMSSAWGKIITRNNDLPFYIERYLSENVSAKLKKEIIELLIKEYRSEEKHSGIERGKRHDVFLSYFKDKHNK